MCFPLFNLADRRVSLSSSSSSSFILIICWMRAFSLLSFWSCSCLNYVWEIFKLDSFWTGFLSFRTFISGIAIESLEYFHLSLRGCSSSSILKEVLFVDLRTTGRITVILSFLKSLRMLIKSYTIWLNWRNPRSVRHSLSPPSKTPIQA